MVAPHDLRALLGSSVPMRDVAAQLESAAGSPATLLVGETGVGKYHVARLLHALSGGESDFFVLDCAAAPGEAGGVTAAITAHGGARAGTAYLEEIASLARPDQGLLLSAMTEVAAGASLRIIASTERDLATEVSEGRFDEALYYRIGVKPIYLPPLRARSPEDVREMIATLMEELRRGLPDAPRALSDRALDLMLEYHWPGNLRELRNALERALFSARGAACVDVMHLPEEMLDAPAGIAARRARMTLADVERRHIERTLRAHGANRTHAARELGISRATLIKKIREYDTHDRQAGIVAGARGLA